MTYTTAKAALLLGIKSDSVRSLIKRELIAATKHGRDWVITQEEIDRYNRERLGKGMSGRKHSEETKEKMRQARLKNPTIKSALSTLTTTKRRANGAKLPRGDKASNWKGGRHLDSNGYIIVYAPDHPYAVRHYVLEHRIIVEREIGRQLIPSEIIHHKNGIITDNRPENLEIMTRSEHKRFHILNPHIRRKAS